MATTYIGELIESGEGELTSQPAEQAVRIFKVQSDSSADNHKTAISTTGIPGIGDAYPGNVALTAQRIRAEKPMDSWKIWHVTVEYSTLSGTLNPNPGGDDLNPLNRPPIEEWGFETYTEVAQKARRLNPITSDFTDEEQAILNSAGEIFQDPPQKTLFLPVVRFTRNEANFSYSIASEYVGTVNSAAWLGAAQHEVLCSDISANLNAGENGFPQFWSISYTFRFKTGGWYTDILDAGFYFLNKSATPPQLKPILDNDGIPVTRPRPLDGTGGLLDLEDATDISELAVYRRYLLYEESDFGDFDLTP